MRRGPAGPATGLTPGLWAVLLTLSLAPLLLGACQQKAAEAKGERSATPDSLAAADSVGAGADSLAAGEAESRGGFLARVFGGRKENKEEEKEEPVPVHLARVEVQDVPLYLSATATLEAEKRADILAKIAGEIRRMLAEEGDWVREGQVLAVLDGEAQAVAVEEADARARSLQLDLDRVTTLHEQGLTSDKELHDARFRLEEAEAQRKGARLQLAYTEIKAPFSGRICERFVDRGQSVAVGTRVFSIVDADPLLASIHLPEKEAARISPAQRVLVNPDASPTQEFPAEVLRLSPMVDPRTGTVKVTCQIAEPGETLRPGSFVRVKIQTDVHTGVPVIPKRALVPEGGETYVFKVEADSVVKVPVVTDYANGRVVEITQGLMPGEQVVTVGQGALKTGSKFRDVGDERVMIVEESDSTGSALR